MQAFNAFSLANLLGSELDQILKERGFAGIAQPGVLKVYSKKFHKPAPFSVFIILFPEVLCQDIPLWFGILSVHSLPVPLIQHDLQ